MKHDPQRTEAWLRKRLGRITATRFSIILDGGPGAWNTLLDRVQSEIEDPDAAIQAAEEQFSGGNLAFGRDNEPALLARYELERGVEIERPDLIIDAELDYVAASPDGILPDRTIEGKCRIEQSRHAETILRRAPEDEHIAQVQGQMMVARRELADFVSYCPSWRAFETKLIIIEVPIDRELVERLREGCVRFWGLLQRGERLDERGADLFQSDGVPSFF